MNTYNVSWALPIGFTTKTKVVESDINICSTYFGQFQCFLSQDLTSSF